MSSDKFTQHSEYNLELFNISTSNHDIITNRSTQEHQKAYTSYRCNSDQPAHGKTYDSSVHHSYLATDKSQFFGLKSSTGYEEVNSKRKSSPLCGFCGYDHNPKAITNTSPNNARPPIRNSTGNSCPDNKGKGSDSSNGKPDPGGGGDNNGGKRPILMIDTVSEDVSRAMFGIILFVVVLSIILSTMCNDCGASSLLAYFKNLTEARDYCRLITNRNLKDNFLTCKGPHESSQNLPKNVHDAYNVFKRAISDKSCSADSCPGLANYASFYWGAAVASTRNTKYFQNPARCRCRNSGLVCRQGSLPSKDCTYCTCESIKPDVIIREGLIVPGDCYSFSGEGQILIKFFNPLYVFGVTYRHPNKFTVGGSISSAPKDFIVWGYNQTDDLNPVLLGRFEYKAEQYSSQTFEVDNTKEQYFSYVQLNFLNNHGNAHYTTVYKVEVHGFPEIESLTEDGKYG